MVVDETCFRSKPLKQKGGRTPQHHQGVVRIVADVGRTGCRQRYENHFIIPIFPCCAIKTLVKAIDTVDGVIFFANVFIARNYVLIMFRNSGRLSYFIRFLT
jgi:hypothetical protein